MNFNAGPLLARCVRSLLADDSAGTPEVVVVDNGSTDGSVEALEATGLPVQVVRAPGNVGYAAGANLGIATTGSPVVAVLNPDTEVRRGTGAALLARLEESDVAAVGPRILNTDGTVYPSGRAMPSTLDAVGHGLLFLVWPRNPFTRRYRYLDADYDSVREVDWLSGAAIWLRRSALDAVGGWDEGYFMYVEDVDLCWRLRQAGWRIVFDPAGEVEHVQGTATGRRPYRMLARHHRSLFRFAAKRWQGPRRVLLLPAGIFLVVRAGLAMLHHVFARRWRPQGVSRAPGANG